MNRLKTILLGILTTTGLFGATYYVDASRLDDSGNGLGWATAKKTIQATVNLSAGGDSVIVTNGVYSPITTSNKAITIQSVNGASLTSIDGANGQRCATLGTDDGQTNTVVAGFTLRNGRVSASFAQGGGVLYGTLSSCIVSNNTADSSDINLISGQHGAYGGGCYGTVLIRCIINSNLANAYLQQRSTSSQYSHAEGGGTYGCIIRDCLIYNNNATARGYGDGQNIDDIYAHGGGASGGVLINSTITRNSLVSSFRYNGSSPAEGTAREALGYGCYGVTATNSIVWANNGENYNSSVFKYSCSSPLPSGTGNISADPLFKNPASSDFHLQSSSPCINGGTNDLVLGAFDLAGNPRIIDSLVDMGAYESLGPFAVNFNAQGGTAPAPSSIMVTNTFAYGTLAATTKAGYIFGGWYTNATYTGSAITFSTIVTLTSAHTLYANWALDPYYVAGGANAAPVGITAAVNSDVANSGDGLISIKLGGIGLLADGQMAGIQWLATGPGILAFDWKVSSEADYDWLMFYEEGSATTNKISGTIDWAHMSVTVTGAVDLAHTFRWEYEKDPISEYFGQDAGWVDAISWMPLYTVTVNNGSGDGYYTNNAYASITADAAAAHYEFDRWTGDTNTVANIFAASTTLRMPNTHATVTATYKPILYPLSAASATGGGSYPYATTVEIRATAFENKRFYRWNGDVGSVADVNAATTTVVTSDQAISVTATYTVPLTVNSGSGSGWYPEGSAATVSADADPMWKEFAVWTGDAGLLSNANARTTTLTLPTAPATVTATYKDSIARLTGSYGRTYSELGTAGAITIDATAGSLSGTPAVKLGGAGVIPDNGYAAFETVVSGTGWVYFQWKVSSESNADYLKFKVDGSEVASISGTKGPWTQFSNRVETAGEHTFRWEYVKNASVSSSTDAGWVDDIVWIGDVQAPALNPEIISATTTNSLMALDFIGERGISYVLQTNATLNTLGWGDWSTLTPEYVGETNGVHRFNIAPSMLGHDKMFYRIIGR